MSFFKRNDPNAPAARRAPAGDAYSRLPNESYGAPQRQAASQQPPPQAYQSQPRQYQQQPQQPQQPQQTQQPPQLPRRQDPYEEKFRSSQRVYQIDPCPSDPLALSNRLVVNEQDFGPDTEFVILRGQFIFAIMYVLPRIP